MFQRAVVIKSISLVLMMIGRLCGEAGLEVNEVRSPNGRIALRIQAMDGVAPRWNVLLDGYEIASGSLGLELQQFPRWSESLALTTVERETVRRSYSVPVGKRTRLEEHFNEARLMFDDSSVNEPRGRLICRVFDDGVAFRWTIPEQTAIDSLTVMADHTSLHWPEKTTVHYLPLRSYTTSYENYYETKPVAEVPVDQLVGLPVLVEQMHDDQRMWIGVTEADLVNFPGLYLQREGSESAAWSARLSPLPGRDDGAKSVNELPLELPWRVLLVGDSPRQLLESDIVFHLSRPCAIADTSWIRPGRTTFPWWNGYFLQVSDFEPGLNTETHKHYIDFCARHGIEYHSLDGTDTAWYGGPIVPNAPTDITTAVPEIDLPALLDEARQRGVRLRLWMHWRALQPQIDEAFALYEQWGIEGVMVDFMDRDDQEMVRFYHEVASKAAAHHLTVTFHGCCKPTGMERQWPNVLTFEGVLNQEYNKWSRIGTPPGHNLRVAFIRMLAGPLDYHLGGMQTVPPGDFQPRNQAPLVQGTRCHQLAMYIVYQNHLPMLVDYPQAYRDQVGLEFLTSVPVSWDETRVLQAEFDHCIAVARRAKDIWYVAAMTGSEEAHLSLPLDFLQGGTLIMDEYLEPEAGERGPAMRRQRPIAATDTIRLRIPGGGGWVAVIHAR